MVRQTILTLIAAVALTGCQTTGGQPSTAATAAQPVVPTSTPIAFRFDGSDTTGSLTVSETTAIYCDTYLKKTGQKECHTVGYELDGNRLVLEGFRYAWHGSNGDSNLNLTAKVAIDGYTGTCFSRLMFTWAGYIRGKNQFPASAKSC